MEHYDIKRRYNPRILLFFWINLILTSILLFGLARQQFFMKDAYEDMERRQTERRIFLPGPRGDIYDRNGNLLVGNRPHYSATVILDDLRPDFRKEYSKLIRKARAQIETESVNEEISTRLPDYYQLKWEARTNVIQKYLDIIESITQRKSTLKRSKIIRHFNEQLLLPLPLTQDLSASEYAQLIERLPVRSPINIHTSSARYYPYNELSVHTLGYVQNVNPDLSQLPKDGIKNFTYKTKIGKTGIENSFNQQLMGEKGYEIWQVDPLGYQNKQLELKPPKQGNDLIASIDIELQKIAEIALGNRTGAAIALDIETGEVLTLASHPNYDLNDLSPFIPQNTFNEINDAGAWLNRAVQLSYPPGSTFKLITAIAGLKSGLIDDTTSINCPGVYRVGNRIYHCHAKNGHGTVNLEKAIAASCNVFFYDIGLKLGIDKINAEAKHFKLDQHTGIELPFETKRIVIPSKSWKREIIGDGWTAGDTANTAIGQGFLLVTPLQMACTIASIARNETHTQPTLLAVPRNDLGNHLQSSLPTGLTSEQRNLLLKGMQGVTSSIGTGRLIHIEDLPIAGKTGTADFRAHGKEVNLAWFVGFAPINDPKIAVAVMVEGTQESDDYHGGSTAGPIAKDLFLAYQKKYLNR
jgi:penicillin-binding protein 2